LQFSQKIDDLGLHRYVQRRYRFIADDDPAVAHECPCDTDALLLTTREFMGVASCVRLAETYSGEDFKHPRLALFASKVAFVDVERLSDDTANAHPGIKRGIGRLKDHLHVAHDITTICCIKRVDINASYAERPRRWSQGAYQHARERRFATSRLSDDPEGLPLCKRQVNIANCIQLQRLRPGLVDRVNFA
jgi:hypothetical protein